LTFFRIVTLGVAIVPPALVVTGLGGYVEQSIYRYPDFAKILLVMLIALPFATDIAVLGGAYRGVLNPAPSILANFVVQPTVRLTIMGLLFVLGFRLWAVVVATSASYVVSWLMLALLARKDMPGSSPPDRPADSEPAGLPCLLNKSAGHRRRIHADHANEDARYGEIILETKNALAGDAE
jgi:hypothetical protein